MTRAWRALKPEFVQHIDLEVTFPAEKAFKKWLKNRYSFGYRSGSYTKLRDGLALPMRIVESFVVYCLEHDGSPARQRLSAATKAFCAGFGLRNFSNLPEVLAVVAPTVDGCERGPAEHGEEFLSSLCARTRDWPERVLPAETQADLEATAHWVRVEMGRQLRVPKRVDTLTALAAAQAALGTSASELAAHAADWCDREPRSVALAIERGARIGASIALPLCPPAYECLRRGDIDPSELQREDILSPSPDLFIEGFAMIPRSGYAWEREPSVALMTATVGQWAYLTHVKGVGEAVPLRLLACATSEVTKKRLLSFGFVDIGTTRGKSSLALMERVVHISASRPLPAGCRGDADAALWGNWRAIQLALGAPPQAGQSELAA